MAEGLLRFISADECGETGYVVSKVLTSGKHTLEFDFGRQKAYAHNDTGENLDFEGWESLNSGEVAKPDFEGGDELELGLGPRRLHYGDSITVLYTPTGDILQRVKVR